MPLNKRDTARLGEMQSGDTRWFLMIRGTTRPFTPPTDVIELADKLIVLVEIAGMRASDFNITLLDHHLLITGTREFPQHTNAAFHQVEIGFGEFRVEVALPWIVEREQVTATYETGFLQVELPRKPARQINVISKDGEQG